MAKVTQRHATRGLTEGAILAALTVVVGAVGLVAPFVGILLAPLPIMLLVIRWGLRTAVLASVVAALILLQFFGPLNAISVTAMFAPLGLALGWGVWRGIGAQLTVLAGAAAFLVSTVATLAAATFMMHQDLVGQFITSQVQGMQMALALQQKIGAPSQQIDEMRQIIAILPGFLHTALPVIFALGALVWAYLCYVIARTVLRRVGHVLPGVPPILSWRIPPGLASVLLWIAAVLALATLRVPALRGAATDAMLVNVLVFAFQGALVGIIWMKRRQIPWFAQVLAGVLLLTAGLLPILAVTLLGMLDTWFDYRRLTGGPQAPARDTVAARDPQALPFPKFRDSGQDTGPAPRAPEDDAGGRHGGGRASRIKAVHPR
jgi:uncharacterized protein YybS (DUF2232 family)